MTIFKKLGLLSGVRRLPLLTMNTAFAPETFTLSVSIPNGAVLSFNYGDGSSELLVGPLVMGTDIFTHNYSSGVYKMGFVGNFDAVTKLYMFAFSLFGDISEFASMPNLTELSVISGQSMDYTSTVLPPWSGTKLYLYDTRLSTTEVDNFLVDLDTAGGGGGLSRVDLHAPCAVPSATGLAAKTSLEGKGWVVIVAT